MIHEIYKNKNTEGILGFDLILDGIINEFGKILGRVLPGGAILINKFFEPGAECQADWLSDSDDDSVNIVDCETGEITKTKEPNVIGVMTLVAALHESRYAYSEGNADIAWKILVYMSCVLRDLSIKFDSMDADGMPSNEIILLRSALSAHGKKGGLSKGEKTRPLREWAINEAKKLGGTTKDKTRILIKRLPAEFHNSATDPEGIIYKTLLAENNSSNRKIALSNRLAS